MACTPRQSLTRTNNRSGAVSCSARTTAVRPSRPPLAYAAAYVPSLLSMICRSRCASDADVTKYVKRTIVRDPAIKSVAYQTPRRRPYTRGLLSRSTTDDIPDAAHGVQQLLFERPIEFLAQPADQDVD